MLPSLLSMRLPSRKTNKGPRVCQVPGCTQDLSKLRGYHSRHRICLAHMNLPSLVINGTHSRFCQQCAKFEAIECFDGGRRTCRMRLEAHNTRRRKGFLAGSEEADQPLDTTRLGMLSRRSDSANLGTLDEHPDTSPMALSGSTMLRSDSDFSGSNTVLPSAWREVPDNDALAERFSQAMAARSHAATALESAFGQEHMGLPPFSPRSRSHLSFLLDEDIARRSFSAPVAPSAICQQRGLPVVCKPPEDFLATALRGWLEAPLKSNTQDEYASPVLQPETPHQQVAPSALLPVWQSEHQTFRHLEQHVPKQAEQHLSCMQHSSAWQGSGLYTTASWPSQQWQAQPQATVVQHQAHQPLLQQHPPQGLPQRQASGSWQSRVVPEAQPDEVPDVPFNPWEWEPLAITEDPENIVFKTTNVSEQLSCPTELQVSGSGLAAQPWCDGHFQASASPRNHVAVPNCFATAVAQPSDVAHSCGAYHLAPTPLPASASGDLIDAGMWDLPAQPLRGSGSMPLPPAAAELIQALQPELVPVPQPSTSSGVSIFEEQQRLQCGLVGHTGGVTAAKDLMSWPMQLHDEMQRMSKKMFNCELDSLPPAMQDRICGLAACALDHSDELPTSTPTFIPHPSSTPAPNSTYMSTCMPASVPASTSTCAHMAKRVPAPKRTLAQQIVDY